MTRMSKSVSLVLIGSSLILAGCGVPRTTSAKATDQETDQETRPGGGGSGGHGPGGYYHPWYSRGGSYWGWGWAGASGRPGPGGARPGGAAPFRGGGFGSSGHAAGS